jgi:hypothetical protein
MKELIRLMARKDRVKVDFRNDCEWTCGRRSLAQRHTRADDAILPSVHDLLVRARREHRRLSRRSIARMALRKAIANEQRPTIENRFNRLADKWELETKHISSPVRKAEHIAYQQIIALGEGAIPLMLQRMRDSGGHWFWALSLLANFDPVAPASRGNVLEMRDAWLRWGHENGHC